MNILFLTPKNPFPAVSGGLVKTSRLLQYLSKNHILNVAVLHSMFDNDDQTSCEDKLRNSLPDATIYVASSRNRRSKLVYLKSALLNKPYPVVRNSSTQLVRYISHCAEKYDVIFVDHYIMLQFVPSNLMNKVVFHAHNAEFNIWKRYSSSTNFVLHKVLTRIEALRIARYERNAILAVGSILASPNDIESFLKISPHSDKSKFFTTLHLGDDKGLNLPLLDFSTQPNNICFIGTLSWEPNANGIIWFLKEVWPIVRSKEPQVKLFIAGSGANPPLIQFLSSIEGVHFLGFVDSLESVYSQCKVCIAPLQFGAGIKVKVVDAMYRGIPIVTTTIGAEGLSCSSGHELLIADEANSFASNIMLLLTNKATWQSISIQSRHFASNNFSWDSIFNNVERAMKHVSR